MTENTKPTASACKLKSAVGHWRAQRITAVVLIPLTIWMLIFLQKALVGPYADTVAWLATPINMLAIVAWIAAVGYHAALGLQVVFEDYVSHLPTRHFAIKAVNLIFLGIGSASILTTLIIFFQG